VKKIGKWLLYLLIVLVLIVIVGSHVMDSVMYYTDKEIIQLFSEHEASGSVEYIRCGGVNTRVIRSTTGQKDQCIIFSHGAPGSWDAFKDFLTDIQLLKTADLVGYDRPGYGNSYDVDSHPDIEFQAECLLDIVVSRDYEEVYLVGHSFGGPIIIEAALAGGKEIDGVILLAPVVDPETEKFFPGGKLAYWSLSRWVWPTGFQVSADEKYTHVEELRSLEAKMHKYSTPTLFVHSTDDWIAPATGNIEYINRNIPDSLLVNKIYDDKSHLFIWTDQEMVVELILDFMNGELKEND